MKKKGGGFCSRTALLQRVKTLNIKACFGLDIEGEERRVERQQELTASGPYQDSLQRRKKQRQGLGEREKVKIRGKEREGPFSSEKGT